MGRKEFLERVRRIPRKKDSETLAQIGVEKVEEVIEQTDENAIKTATSAVYDFYQNATKKLSDEEKGEFINEFTNLLLKSKNVDKNEEVAADFLNTMLKEDEVPNKYVIDSAKELPDSRLTMLTEENGIPIDDRKQLVSAMGNEDMRNEQFDKLKMEEDKRRKKVLQKERKMLQKIYNECEEETTDSDLVVRIDNTLNNIKYLSEQEINKSKAEIIAKKIAQNYKRFGYSNLKFLSQAMSAREMMNAGIINLVEEETTKISNGKEEFDKTEDLKMRLIREVQEDYAKYNEESELEKIRQMLNGFPKGERIEMIESIKKMVQSKQKSIKDGIKSQGDER